MLFLASDTHLITTGSRDFCILQWLVEGNLPPFNEEEEYQMGGDTLQVSRHQNGRGIPADESYYSDYSNDRVVDNNYDENKANGRTAEVWQSQSENNRHSDNGRSTTRKVPVDHRRPSRKTYQQVSSRDEPRATEQSPQRNAFPQNKSQKGSYAQRFHKHKASHPQQEPEDLIEDSDDDINDRQPPYRQPGGGREQSTDQSPLPLRGVERRRDRRPMK